MNETRRYELDGMTIDIPIYYDERAEMYIEDYPDFQGNPIYTPNGHPLVLCIEDACEYGEMTKQVAAPDCGTCKYFRRATEKTLFGVCHHEKRKNFNPQKEAK